MQIIVIKANNILIRTNNKSSRRLNINYSNFLDYNNTILIFIAIDYDNLVNFVVFQNKEKRIILFSRIFITANFVNSFKK